MSHFEFKFPIFFRFSIAKRNFIHEHLQQNKADMYFQWPILQVSNGLQHNVFALSLRKAEVVRLKESSKYRMNFGITSCGLISACVMADK